MNRPGQPQQRPPNLSSNPGLASQFRPPFPNYALPPRNVNVLQGGYVPGLQPASHRTSSQATQAPSMTPQSASGYLQSRGQAIHSFGGALGQHQSPASALQQQIQAQQSNGTTQSVTTPDVSLDPNDFPALGSSAAPASNPSGSGGGGGGGNSSTSGNGASYATQAGTGVQLGNPGGSGSGPIVAGGGSGASQPRDFTPDDFPALGGQSQNQNQHSSTQSQNENHSHPPGLNGYQQHSDHSQQQQQQQQHRSNLLGALGGSIPPGTPGMLNLGVAQARNIHPGFQQQGQSDAEKQQQRNNYALKLNQPSHATWSSPNPNPPPISGNSSTNGAHSQSISTHLNAPPGAPSPSGGPPFPQTQGPGSNNGGAVVSQPYSSNGAAQGDSHGIPASHSPSNPSTSTNTNISSLQDSVASSQPPHPQTPAQQVLISPADRWGLLGLLETIKNASTDVDGGLSAMGTDLSTMGLDMTFPGSLYPTFITPWADHSAAHSVEPEFHLPACYLSVHAPPPGPSKASAFSDETLFFMFYSSPRDALQEVAAQELWNRNWRYHKDLQLWITKESGTTPSQKVQGGEQGQYTFWDPENWCKDRKEMTVLYTDLEEKNAPAFALAPTLIPVAQNQGVVPQQQQPVQGQQLSAQVQAAQRGSFQMGMASL